MRQARPKYHLNQNGEFIIENYNQAKTFSSFFPGIAGLFGIPMWLFYTNRGQCVSSFGTSGKDGAIMEFQPANKAYRLTPHCGFRTFIKIKDGRAIFYEPFQSNPQDTGSDKTQKMIITPYDLKIIETNRSLGLETEVHYFTIPNQPYAALSRVLKIKNLTKKQLHLEVLDGAPAIIPYGMTYRLQKDMSRTIEAWMRVVNMEHKAPFYHLKVVVADKPYVVHLKEGNFYLSYHYAKNKPAMLEPVVDPDIIFGSTNNLCNPENFLKEKTFNVPKKQKTANRTPSAMAYLNFNLNKLGEKTIYSVFGYTDSVQKLNNSLNKLTNREFLAKKNKENITLIDQITNSVFTASSSLTFDLYCRQTFLDNIMRGGYPLTLETQEGPVTFHVYSRKHGDPERDYNKFVLLPTYFSQGNGNYRDINQNRRNDVWINPDVKDSNIVTFLNLLQADGYNPLVVKGVGFKIKNAGEIQKILRRCAHKQDIKALENVLKKSFTPGDLLLFIETQNIKLKCNIKTFLNMILTHSVKNEQAEHGEGYWIDHWTYNTDLFESYLAIYPEELKNLLLQKRAFTFFQSPAKVKPRIEKYLLLNGQVRRYHAIAGYEKDFDTVKEALNLEGDLSANKMRAEHGKGQIYKTTLIVKLLCLMANKISSLGPAGVGMEMEADKPGWYDALNGLPGLLGSSTPETFELKRLAEFLLKSLEKIKVDKKYLVRAPEEICKLVTEINKALEENLKNKTEDIDYWDKSNTAKEVYRQRIKLGFSGSESDLTIDQIIKFLKNVSSKLDLSIKKAYNPAKQLYNTYYVNEVVKYKHIYHPGTNKKKLNPDGLEYVWPTKFKQKPLPLFLEGNVRAIKILPNKTKVKQLYEALKKSDLYDKKLGMYKVSGYLKKESEEIGRTSVFPRGWLENESIWLHMEYKYILELLKSGLYNEFYAEFRNCLIPFQDPQVYGRSILENSSFIASSANFDKDIHGTGFVARLSGSTAEFIHIWLAITVGETPFYLNDRGGLSLKFEPVLDDWLFTTQETTRGYYKKDGKLTEVTIPKNCLAFNFLKNTLVVYSNPRRLKTYKSNGKPFAAPKRILFKAPDGKKVAINGNTIPSPYAQMIREGRIDKIDITLG